MTDATTPTAAGRDETDETMSVQLIDHALQAMLNEHGAAGWELVAVDDGLVAQLRRPRDGAIAWEYATVLVVPAARQAILDQWTAMGYELVLEHGTVAYMKRPRGTG